MLTWSNRPIALEYVQSWILCDRQNIDYVHHVTTSKVIILSNLLGFNSLLFCFVILFFL